MRPILSLLAAMSVHQSFMLTSTDSVDGPGGNEIAKALGVGEITLHEFANMRMVILDDRRQRYLFATMSTERMRMILC